MDEKYRRRRIISFLFLLAFLISSIAINTPKIVSYQQKPSSNQNGELAINKLSSILVKGRAPNTDYSRDKFSADWADVNGCSMRDIILNRDLKNPVINDSCQVVSGELNDPYTGKIIQFSRGKDTSSNIQIDHVVALADAWQKGAQMLSSEMRFELANDPLELIAVSGRANQQKSASDAASWLPSNKSFRCEYVARQIAVKIKYSLWMTSAEKQSIKSVLEKCPDQLLPSP